MGRGGVDVYSSHVSCLFVRVNSCVIKKTDARIEGGEQGGKWGKRWLAKGYCSCSTLAQSRGILVLLAWFGAVTRGRQHMMSPWQFFA